MPIEDMLLTKNKKGFDLGKPTYKIEDWIACYDLSKPEKPLLDVGSGLGTNVMAALSQGCRVIAADMTEEHLADISNKAGEEAVSSGQLETILGNLPDDVPLNPESVSGILCAQVIHFLNPDEVAKSFHNFSSWLAPGGKLIVLACSHYHGFNLITGKYKEIDAKAAKEGKYKEIEAKAAKEGAQNPLSFPGFVHQEEGKALMEWWQDQAPSPYREVLPGPEEGFKDGFQTFSDKQLAALAEHNGLKVLEACFCGGFLSNYPVWVQDMGGPREEHHDENGSNDKEYYKGKEQVVLVAQKPLRECDLS